MDVVDWALFLTGAASGALIVHLIWWMVALRYLCTMNTVSRRWLDDQRKDHS